MKVLIISILAVATSGAAFAATTGTCATGVKVKSADAGCCASKAKTVAKTESACASKAAKPVAKAAGAGSCAVKAKTVAKTESCCASKAAKPVAKAGKGCCNAAGEFAKYKVFVDGQYMFYGCQGSAGKARTEMVAVAFNVGKIQIVTGKVMIPKNQQLVALAR